MTQNSGCSFQRNGRWKGMSEYGTVEIVVRLRRGMSVGIM